MCGLAAERLKAAGLADRVTLPLQDYRHLEGMVLAKPQCRIFPRFAFTFLNDRDMLRRFARLTDSLVES